MLEKQARKRREGEQEKYDYCKEKDQKAKKEITSQQSKQLEEMGGRMKQGIPTHQQRVKKAEEEEEK